MPLLDNHQKDYLAKLKAIKLEHPVINLENGMLKTNADFIVNNGYFDALMWSLALKPASITIQKQALISFYQKLKNNGCLATSNCFGITTNGELTLMTKGIVLNDASLSEYDQYISVFKTAAGKRELFSDLSLAKPVNETVFKANKKRFKDIYPTTRWTTASSPSEGYSLPVDAMLAVLQDNTLLGTAENITFSFGITQYYDDGLDNLGNFEFYISNDTISTFVVCTSRPITGAFGECPPRIPCQ